ncbi:MAG: sulfurtransferase complex subunit TusB [Thioploca sp.]|nr:sulfurtransferase complex subunit TusB [Thioploca sp.]
MLHTVNKSPFEKNSLETCLRFARQGHTILLYEDGIYAALKGTVFEAKMTATVTNCKIYVLVPDLEARGMRMDNVVAGIQPVDYAGFVDLVVENNPVQAWL